MSTRVVIVGGGLAGLSAAVHARAGGAEVTLVDPGPLGGTARTAEPAPGWRIETGPHTFTARCPSLLALITALGLRDDVVPLGSAAKARFLRRNGKLKANAGALGLGEVFALVRGLFARANTADDASIREWVAARFGERVADEVVGAMVTGIWASLPEEVEMASAFPAVAAAVKAHGTAFSAAMAARRKAEPSPLPGGTWTVKGGLGRIGERAEQQLGGQRLRATADSIRREGDEWVVATSSGELRADRVIVALPAWRAAPLLEEVAPNAAAALAGIEYSPILGAHWTSRDCAFPVGFGYLASKVEKAPVLGMLFTSDLFPDRVPAGARGGATLLGGTREPVAVELSEAEVRRRILAEHQTLTGKAMTLDTLTLVRHPYAVAVPAPGHAALRARVHAALPTGLRLAGAWDGSGAMEDAARSGQDAARAALEAA